MKLHILHDFKDGPWGGGNQFLKALREELRKKDRYSETFENADAYLLNAFPFRRMEFFLDTLKQKIKYNKPIFYRLDGLFYVNRLNDNDRYIDNLCTNYLNNFSSGVVYQTEWIKEIQQDFGVDKTIPSIVCLNAPSSEIFKYQDIIFPEKGEKIKFVATCWAPNERKGFKYYKFLDENLDFSKYEMTFIGNSPIEFKNIKMKKPLATNEIAEELKNYHAFISCAFNEPCSNSLIEALHTGIPALGHNSGGTPDIIKDSGVLFNNEDDIVDSVDKLSKDLKNYSNKIELPTIEQVAENYYNFMLEQYNNREKSNLTMFDYKRFRDLLISSGLIETKILKVKKIIVRCLRWTGLKK